jgi:hypothetical protein
VTTTQRNNLQANKALNSQPFSHQHDTNHSTTTKSYKQRQQTSNKTSSQPHSNVQRTITNQQPMHTPKSNHQQATLHQCTIEQNDHQPKTQNIK